MTGRRRPGAGPAKPGTNLVGGHSARLGATFDGDGVNFAVYSEHAESVTLCLFDSGGRETRSLEFREVKDGVWHGYLPRCQPGQLYGYRVQGPYSRQHGLRFNRSKLLIDPYARALDGEFRWNPAVFDFRRHGEEFLPEESDSAPFVPKSVVTASRAARVQRKRGIAWSKTILYEANVRGYTMRHPGVPEADRGTFRGMSNASVLAYLKSLGVSSIELMPVQEFIDEERLVTRGLQNYWGYNCVSFFVPARRYAGSDPIEEFRDMVNAIHDAGLEVILDIAFNHTGESDADGPTIGFRGLDNLCYYRTVPGQPGVYVNDTGCGNTLNVDHPRVRELLMDSLRYWVTEMGVDGFRFDLATVLGRSGAGFTARHPMLQAIETDKILSNTKLIAEPWDPGPGGYQLGQFPPRWREWNDRYRDSLRRFWRGETGEAAEFARRLHGSADIFESGGRGPLASINFVTAHDGYTLADLVSYEQRHNEANGEDNRDGHLQNYSCNHGAEGETGDVGVNAMRRRQRLNLLASLLLSQGVPMLLAGDEFGNSQHGNNNAYAQDNETGWLDWTGLDADPDFRQRLCDFIRLRKATALLRQDHYVHGVLRNSAGWQDIDWLRPDGMPMQSEDWSSCRALTLALASARNDESIPAVALMFNVSAELLDFRLPDADSRSDWQMATASTDELPVRLASRLWPVPARSVCCAVLERRAAQSGG